MLARNGRRVAAGSARTRPALGCSARHPPHHLERRPHRAGYRGYIAKHATKAAEWVGTLERRIYHLDTLDAFNLRDHARRLITTCLRLDALPELAELRLTDWAHMLEFCGYFSTRSRRYSTTIGELRAARKQHARDNDITTGRLPLFDEDTVLVVSAWEYAGKGHSLGDQLLVAALTGTSLTRPTNSEAAPHGLLSAHRR